jgi:hypothetical protein
MVKFLYLCFKKSGKVNVVKMKSGSSVDEILKFSGQEEYTISDDSELIEALVAGDRDVVRLDYSKKTYLPKAAMY